MKFPDAIQHRMFQTAGGIVGFVCLWAVALLSFSWLGIAPGISLIVTGVLPLMFAVFPLLWRKTLSLPFLLPGLLIFFKQNDALIQLFGDAPIIDLLALAVGLTIVFQLKQDQFKSTLSEAALIFLSLAGLLTALIISSVNAIDLDRSAQHTITFAKDAVFACLIAFSIRDTRDLKSLVNWLILSTSFSAAIMVFDALNGGTVFPTFEGANWQGSIRSGGASTESVPDVATMVLFGTLAAGALAVRTARGRWLYTCAALLGVAAIIASISRSALATLFLAVIWQLWHLRKEPVFHKVISLAGMVLLVVALSMPQPIISKFVALAVPSQDRTVSRRMSYQEIGVDLFQSSPFLGIGSGNYPARYASDDYRFVSGRSTEPRPLHNIYLQFAAEAGILGAIAFLALISSIGATFWRATQARDSTLRHHSEGLLLSYLGICIQLFFLSSKSFLGLWILIGAAIAVARLRTRGKI